MKFFRSPQPSVISPTIINGLFPRDREAKRALEDYRTQYRNPHLVVAKAVRRRRGVAQHLGYKIVPRTQINRYGEVEV